MKRYTARIDAIDSPTAVLQFVWRVARRVSASAFSYHETPVFSAQTSPSTLIFARGYPVAHQKDYVSGGFRAVDPFPALTFTRGPVLIWSEAMQMLPDDPAAQDYFQQMRERGYANGISLALYGPRNRNAYATFAFATPPEAFEPGELSLLHGLVQTAHLRICQLIDEYREPVALSEREREVLEWMARGKSANDIAGILGISAETVRTYTRRLYEKLGASDRVGATVTALKLGLINV